MLAPQHLPCPMFCPGMPAETGTIAGVASALAMALVGAISSYISYQQKKFCFSIQRKCGPCSTAFSPHSSDPGRTGMCFLQLLEGRSIIRVGFHWRPQDGILLHSPASDGHWYLGLWPPPSSPCLSVDGFFCVSPVSS